MESGATSRDEAITGDFQDQFRLTVQKVRSAIASALAAAGIDATNPPVMAQRLGLDRNLAWKITRVIRDEDPFAVIRHLPGRTGIKIFLQSLARQGVAVDTVRRVRQAMADFDGVVERHAGDRETLEIMTEAFATDGQPQHAEGLRKLAFKANGATWGVQARVQVSAHFVVPSEDPDLVDLAIVSGLMGLRRLRNEVSWAVASVRHIADNGTTRSIAGAVPIDRSASAEEPAPLIPAFCSRPLPRLRVVAGRGGVTRFELVEGPIGNTAAVSCVLGWCYRRAASRYRTAEDMFGEHFVSWSTPVEIALHDLLVHRDLDFALDPAAALYSQLPGGPVYPESGRDRGLLPLHESIIRLGSPPDLVTAELPRYGDLVRHATQQLGWDVGAFHGFRLKVRYPPIPSLAVLRYELPDRG